MNTIKLFFWNVLLTKETIKTIAKLFKLNDDDCENIAEGIIDIKRYLDSKDNHYIKLAVHSFEQLIK